MARNPLVKLQPFALEQLGHVSLAQAASVDVTRHDVYRLLRQHALVRVHQGVFRLASTPVTFEGRAMAAALAGGRGAVVSHSWAARLWGATRVPLTEQPEITCPGRIPRRIVGVTAHSSRELDRCDVTQSQRVPVTSGARTVVDLCHDRLDEVKTIGLVDDLIGMRVTTRRWQHLRACQLVRGRAGVHVIVRITKPGAEGEFRSWLERHFARGVVSAFELPRPTYNVPVYDEYGCIGLADALWELGCEVVGEVDGPRFHHLPQDRRRDNQKTNRYAVSGRIPLRFPYEDILSRPAEVADQIRRALRAARR